MMHPRFVAAIVALAAAMSVSSVVTAAQITDVQPTSASTDGSTTITIVGTGFAPAGNLVTVGASPCAVTSETTEQIECTAPEGSGASQPIRVLDAGGQASPPFPFAYTAPSIDLITAAHFPTAGGVPITLTGTNFGPASASREWTVDGVGLACTAGADPHQQMVCPLPPGGLRLKSAPVRATIHVQDSSPTALSYDPPTITAVTPTHGRAGGGFAITVRGENFGTSAAVTVGGASCPVVEHDHTEITCTLPPPSGAPADVRVMVDDRASNDAPFSYEPVLSKCDGGKLKAAASYAQCLGNLQAKAAQKGLDPTDAAIAKCDDKFTESCAKAEYKFSSDCSQPGTCAALQQTTNLRGWAGWIRGTVN